MIPTWGLSSFNGYFLVVCSLIFTNKIELPIKPIRKAIGDVNSAMVGVGAGLEFELMLCWKFDF
jgi:hypothetical protein